MILWVHRSRFTVLGSPLPVHRCRFPQRSDQQRSDQQRSVLLIHHWQIGLPGTDLIAVELGHHPGDLADMAQVVHYPGGQ